jgi:hypothetical protein
MEKFEIIDVETMISQGTKEIGFGEFDGCANLTEVEILKCTSLEHIYVPASMLGYYKNRKNKIYQEKVIPIK